MVSGRESEEDGEEKMDRRSLRALLYEPSILRNLGVGEEPPRTANGSGFRRGDQDAGVPTVGETNDSTNGRRGGGNGGLGARLNGRRGGRERGAGLRGKPWCGAGCLLEEDLKFPGRSGLLVNRSKLQGYSGVGRRGCCAREVWAREFRGSCAGEIARQWEKSVDL